MDSRPRVVVITGPTAVGKTALAIDLALRFGGEVVNADSRYLYRGVDIGVAKPTAAEQRGVPHHLIDILPADGEMSLAIYQDLANAAIRDIAARGRLPLLVGGTPLYINAVVEGWQIPRTPPDPAFRARLEAEAAESGIAELQTRLARIDPAAAERNRGNLRRVIRALEVYEKTGIPLSEQEGKGPPPYRTLELQLTAPRDLLHERIDRRAEEQVASGLVEEITSLLNAGLSPDAPSMTSLGYRQLFPYLRGEQSLADAVRQIQYDTHRYVRHQETWLRRNPRAVRLSIADPDWTDQAFRHVIAFLGEAETSEPTPSGAS